MPERPIMRKNYVGLWKKTFTFPRPLTTLSRTTVDLVVSVFKGPEVFFQKFDVWRTTIFGDVTLFDFLVAIVDRSVAFLDSIAERIPVIRDIKHVIDTILLPFEEVVSDLIDWLSEKIG